MFYSNPLIKIRFFLARFVRLARRFVHTQMDTMVQKGTYLLITIISFTIIFDN